MTKNRIFIIYYLYYLYANNFLKGYDINTLGIILKIRDLYSAASNHCPN